jgi:hypothetical protein
MLVKSIFASNSITPKYAMKGGEAMDEYRDTTINREDLDEELSRQASKYIHVAEKAVKAETEYELFKLQKEQLVAIVDSDIRNGALADGRKLTEASIQKEIERSEEYQKASKHLIKLKANKEVMRALRESWYMRKDLLIQLAIKQRAELENLMSANVKAA